MKNINLFVYILGYHGTFKQNWESMEEVREEYRGSYEGIWKVPLGSSEIEGIYEREGPYLLFHDYFIHE